MEDNSSAWWRATARLALVVLSAFAVLASVPLLFADLFDSVTFLALPFGTFLIALAMPCTLAVAIFWFADRQRTLDHRYRVIED